MRPIGTAAIVLLTLTAPLGAWEHDYKEQYGGVSHWVTGYGGGGNGRLTFYCSTLMPERMFAQLLVLVPPRKVGVSSEVLLQADGQVFGPFPAESADVGGDMTLHIDGKSALFRAAQTIYASSDTFEIVHEGESWEFTGADYSESFGAVLDACA